MKRERLNRMVWLLALVLPVRLYGGDFLLHDTFMDNDIVDGSPAVWEYSCQSPDGCFANSSIRVEDGDARVFFNSFAMWSLAEAFGEEISPSNQWSIRARVTGGHGGNSLVGVGIDSYYWAGAMQLGSTNVRLAAGDPHSSDGSSRAHNFYEPWVIQIDVSPERTVSYRWPADDPSDIATVTWSNGSQITPGRPVFWGNWGGTSTFHEVVVSDTHLGVGGDFDVNGQLDVMDINALSAEVRAGTNNPIYNLTNDEVVTPEDRTVWIEKILNTYVGDSNLDGEFNSADMIQVFAANQYEDAETGNSGWAQGDWNGDGDFDSSDLIAAFQDGGYELGPRANVSVVPEPNNQFVFLLGLMMLLGIWRRRR